MIFPVGSSGLGGVGAACWLQTKPVAANVVRMAIIPFDRTIRLVSLERARPFPGRTHPPEGASTVFIDKSGFKHKPDLGKMKGKGCKLKFEIRNGF
jgi:hypothetical protein